MTRRILAADIGGTNSRFAHFSHEPDAGLALHETVWLKTNEVDSFGGLLQQLEQADFGLNPGDCDAAVIAVPGPVREETRADLANVDWPMDLAPVRDQYPGVKFWCINDFAAQAYALQTEAVAGAAVIQQGMADPEAAQAVIGAGTGLGHCALVRERSGAFLAVPSEAGHAVFGFYGDAELDYERFLLAETGKPFPYGDLVVSGLGLRMVHKFLTGRDRSPEETAGEITPDDDTTTWFARFYGRACRNYAFQVVAAGGLTISGGVAAKNPFLVDNDHFRTEFGQSPAYANMLSRIPIRLNANEQSGLWGAAFFGVQRLG